MLKEEETVVTQELPIDKVKYYEIYQARYSEAKPITFSVVLSWLLAMSFGMAFWTLLFRITPTIARLIHL
jgi:hypothetical protein